MDISGIEANLLLLALDDFYGVTNEGKLKQRFIHGYTMEEAQKLRDRLFKAHEHPMVPESDG